MKRQKCLCIIRKSASGKVTLTQELSERSCQGLIEEGRALQCEQLVCEHLIACLEPSRRRGSVWEVDAVIQPVQSQARSMGLENYFLSLFFFFLLLEGLWGYLSQWVLTSRTTTSTALPWHVGNRKKKKESGKTIETMRWCLLERGWKLDVEG